MDISIVIRNYNGRNLLESYLPSIICSAEVYNGNCEIIVVDDGSTDNSVAFLKAHYPRVTIIKNWPNSGNTIDPVNIGVRRSQHDIVLCLDNDVRVEEDFLLPMIKHFELTDVFAVAPKVISYMVEGGIESLTFPRFRRGRLVGFVPGMEAYDIDFDRSVPIFYAPGNAVAYKKSIFLELGGLDSMYKPYYWEDIDICYCAWKRGFKTVYEPESVVYHLGHATIKNVVDPHKVEIIRAKNVLLLTWKNLMCAPLMLQHIIWLTLRLIISIFKKERTFLTSMVMALRQIPEVIRGRKKVKKAGIRLSDSFLFHRLDEVFFSLVRQRQETALCEKE